MERRVSILGDTVKVSGSKLDSVGVPHHSTPLHYIHRLRVATGDELLDAVACIHPLLIFNIISIPLL